MGVDTNSSSSEGSLDSLCLRFTLDRLDYVLVNRYLVLSHGRGHFGGAVVADLPDEGLSMGLHDLLVLHLLVVLAPLELLHIRANDLSHVVVSTLLNCLTLLLQCHLLVQEGLRLSFLLLSFFLLLVFDLGIMLELLDSVLFVLANEVLSPLLVGGVSGAVLTKLLLNDLYAALISEGHLFGLVPLLLEEGIKQVLWRAVLEQVLLRRTHVGLSK